MKFLVCLLFGVVVGSGCTGGTAWERAERVVWEGVEEGEEASDRAPVYLAVRYNPCRCAREAFEVRRKGRWERVALEGEEDAVARLRAEGVASEELEVWWVKGEALGGVFRVEEVRGR